MKLVTVALAALAASAGLASAQTPPGYGKGMTLELARKCIAAAEAESLKNKWQMAIAVIDDTGLLSAFARMDDTQLASIRIAIDKARTANNFRRPSKVFEDGVAGGRNAILGLPGAIPIEGGIPIAANGKIIGAVGVSGGNRSQDGLAAKACVDALQR